MLVEHVHQCPVERHGSISSWQSNAMTMPIKKMFFLKADLAMIRFTKHVGYQAHPKVREERQLRHWPVTKKVTSAVVMVTVARALTAVVHAIARKSLIIWCGDGTRTPTNLRLLAPQATGVGRWVSPTSKPLSFQHLLYHRFSSVSRRGYIFGYNKRGWISDLIFSRPCTEVVRSLRRIFVIVALQLRQRFFFLCSISSFAMLRSSASTMLYRRSMLSVLCPLIFIRTTCGTPARRMLRTAVRRRSWNFSSGTPARFAASSHDWRKSFICSPYLLKYPGRLWPTGVALRLAASRRCTCRRRELVLTVRRHFWSRLCPA